MDGTPKSKRRVRVYDIRCKMIPSPPGTKCRAHLPREGEEEVSPGRRRLLLAGLLVAVLAVGVVVGRFLLP